MAEAIRINYSSGGLYMISIDIVFQIGHDWMSTLFPYMMWKVLYTACWKYRMQKKSPSVCHHTICRAMSSQLRHVSTPPHHNRFMALFPGPPGWTSARRELLDFTVQGKINRGRHTDHPAGRHSIWTNQCPPPPSPHFYRPDALPAAQPTVSKHWRQLVHSD